jgi:hypothetical protein
MTLVWKSGWDGLTESEAIDYVAAVEAADGQELEFGVAKAINDFVVGCKSDGIWNAIKASCILAGARTTNGALVPLVGTAPTPNNFDLVGDTDYDRKTGLKGNGTNKYLNSNYSDSTGSQNNRHVSAYQAEAGAAGVSYYVAARRSSPFVTTQVAKTSNNKFVNNMQNANPNNFAGSSLVETFVGGSRSDANSEVHRSNGVNTVFTTSSVTPSALNFFVFAGNLDGVANTFSPARLSFYSVGESLDLAKLDTRVSNLITAIGAAIP